METVLALTVNPSLDKATAVGSVFPSVSCAAAMTPGTALCRGQDARRPCAKVDGESAS
jgi:hypothetical protein